MFFYDSPIKFAVIDGYIFCYDESLYYKYLEEQVNLLSSTDKLKSGLKKSNKPNLSKLQEYAKQKKRLREVTSRLNADDFFTVRFCQDFQIESLWCDSNSGNILIDISFFTYVGNTPGPLQRFRLHRGEISSSAVSQLIDKGLLIQDNDSDILTFSQIFFYKEANSGLEIKVSTSQLGFTNLDSGELAYQAYDLIYASKNTANLDSSVKRYYHGPYSLQPRGSLDQWISFVKDSILGYPPAELALTMAFTAPVVSLLNLHGVNVPVLVFDCYGSSSTGKSTIFKFCASAWGLPSKYKGGLLDNFYTTDNAFIAQLSQKQGFPSFFDESTGSRMFKGPTCAFDDIAYQLADGIGKSRCNSDGSLASHKAYWTGSIFINGEVSVLQRCSQHLGLAVRILDFGDIRWTRSAEHSDVINNSIANHYGTAGPAFISALLHEDIDELLTLYASSKVVLESRMPYSTSEISPRLIGSLALLVVTAALIEKYLALHINFDDLFISIKNIFKKITSEKDLFLRAYEYLHEQLNSDYRHYLPESLETGLFSTSEIFGKFHTSKTGELEVWIAAEKLNSYMKTGGFPDAKTVASAWKKPRYNYIRDFDKDRSTRSKRICKVDMTVYVIRLNQLSTSFWINEVNATAISGETIEIL